jgi:transcriptional regulator with XRE-family HTH domain
VNADDASADLATKLGKMLRDGRTSSQMTQAAAAEIAGISRSEWSELERGKTVATIPIVNRAAFAVGGSLDAWIKRTSATTLPRDAVHLKAQELILREGLRGGWQGVPEEMIDREARTSRAADVLLTRAGPQGEKEYSIWDVRDWLEDVGAAVRDFSRRVDALDRYAVARMVGDEPLPRTGGCFVLRATKRNRDVLSDHDNFFRARFPGAGSSWLESLTSGTSPMPKQPALVLVAVNGEQLRPWHF